MSKTTLQGILTIVAGAIAFALFGFKTGNWTDPAALVAFTGAITAGLGLIKAADAQ